MATTFFLLHWCAWLTFPVCPCSLTNYTWEHALFFHHTIIFFSFIIWSPSSLRASISDVVCSSHFFHNILFSSSSFSSLRCWKNLRRWQNTSIAHSCKSFLHYFLCLPRKKITSLLYRRERPRLILQNEIFFREEAPRMICLKIFFSILLENFLLKN